MEALNKLRGRRRRLWGDAAIWAAAFVLVEWLLAAVHLLPSGFAYYIVWMCCMGAMASALRELIAIAWIMFRPSQDHSDAGHR